MVNIMLFIHFKVIYILSVLIIMQNLKKKQNKEQSDMTVGIILHDLLPYE